MADSSSGNIDIWKIELAHAIPTRFTFNPAVDYYPVWSPDGKQIVFSSFRDGSFKLYLKAASGAGDEERITPPSPRSQSPLDWARDGRYILYRETSSQGHAELWILPMTGDRKPRA